MFQLRCAILFTLALFACQAFAGDRIKLTEVEVLTLYKDKRTTGRRSSPVPQLACVGGSAGCSYVPQVVQCYNRGFDGTDVQWECKADMDSAYKFGEIQVTCEGYDYPDDPYILKGSCGLEYKLESTNSGGYTAGSYGYEQPAHKQKSTFFGDLIFYAIIAVAIYTVYRIYVNMADPNRPRGGGTGGYGGPGDGGPPPPGFRPDYYPGDSCGGSTSYAQPGYGTYQRGQNNGPGFWSGLGAGGLLGYMMGNNRGGGYMNRPTTSFWDSGTSSHARPTSSGHFGSMGGGTHTSSGFGGTRRR